MKETGFAQDILSHFKDVLHPKSYIQEKIGLALRHLLESGTQRSCKLEKDGLSAFHSLLKNNRLLVLSFLGQLTWGHGPERGAVLCQSYFKGIVIL
jgi:hypothetical protein